MMEVTFLVLVKENNDYDGMYWTLLIYENVWIQANGPIS
jgi:hypothetical protein